MTSNGGNFGRGGKFYPDKHGQEIFKRNPHATMVHKVRLYASDPENAEGRFTIPLSQMEHDHCRDIIALQCAALGHPDVTFMAHQDDIYCAYVKKYTPSSVDLIPVAQEAHLPADPSSIPVASTWSDIWW